MAKQSLLLRTITVQRDVFVAVLRTDCIPTDFGLCFPSRDESFLEE